MLKDKLSAKDSNPNICKQDALVGAYHLTMPTTKLTGEEAYVLMYTSR